MPPPSFGWEARPEYFHKNYKADLVLNAAFVAEPTWPLYTDRNVPQGTMNILFVPGSLTFVPELYPVTSIIVPLDSKGL
jgi:hypothetical protein